MKLAKTIATGAALFGLATGGALAGEGGFGMNDSGSSTEQMPMAQQETYMLLEPAGKDHLTACPFVRAADGR